MLAPHCPSADQCGGCPLIGCSPEAAQAAREQQLRNALLEHLDRACPAPDIQWRSLPQPQGYRRRIRLRIHEDGGIGFFNREKAADCAVLTPALRQLVRDFVGTAQRYRGPLSTLEHVELREADLDGRAAAYFVQRAQAPGLLPHIHEQLAHWLSALHWTIAAPNIERVPSQRLALPSVWQYVPISSFLQVNAAINALLVGELVAAALQRSVSSFCDLYAGAGNFSLPLLANGLTGDSVEIDPHAGRAARHAATLQGLHSGDFVASDAGGFAADAVAKGRRYDLVIVDPPRAGLKGQAANVAAITRHYIAYCSCNPHTLARDVSVLLELGFKLESLTAYDMFEHTQHVETVVWLRSPATASAR